MDDCIIWKGPVWSQGRYGMDRVEGRSMGAHRAAWIRQKGSIPAGLVVCHKCDNGLCVNVEHLFVGTLSENMQDCVSKGRNNCADQRGSKNNNAKTFVEDRDKLVRNDISLGMSWSQVKEKYGIKSNGHIGQILKRNY